MIMRHYQHFSFKNHSESKEKKTIKLCRKHEEMLLPFDFILK